MTPLRARERFRKTYARDGLEQGRKRQIGYVPWKRVQPTDFNVRYECSKGTVWSHAVASITFSAPYHTSATAEGGSRTNKITCS